MTDERAQVIAMLAARGLRVFWEVFVAACMITWAVTRYHYHRSVVPVDLLPALVLGGFVVYEVTQSIAVVIQYRRTGRREE